MPPFVSAVTLSLCIGAIYTLLAVTVWVTLRRSRQGPQVDLWTLGSLSLGIGVLLIAGRAVLPAWCTFELANALVLAANALRVASLRIGLDLPARGLRIFLVWLACFGVYLLTLHFTPAHIRLGIALVSLSAGTGLVAHHALASARTIPSHSGRALGSVEWMLAVVLAFRAVLVLGGWSQAAAIGDSWPFWLLAGAMMAAALYGNLGYLGMELDRLGAAELRARQAQLDEAARREAAERSATDLRLAIEQRDQLAAERDQLLQMLAHEIRQPLHNAGGALQAAALLVQAPQPADSAEVSDRLLRAQTVLGDVRSVLDNTLAAALMLTRREPLVVQDVDLHLLAHLVLGDLPEAQRDRVQLVWHTPLRSAEMEPGMVRLALRNLLRNAFEHGGAQVRVTLSVAEQVQPPAMVLTVADDGVGSPGPTLEEGGAPTAPPHAGPADSVRRGLGLVIVRRVVALHGGQLQLAPNTPRGLQARMVFPDPGGALAPEELAPAPEPLP